MAAVDFFLKIDGIDGESADAKHKGEIDVESWSWGETNTGRASAGGGGGAGRAVAQDFHFVAHTGKQSPKLLVACAAGSHYKEVTLTCRKAGEQQAEFLKVRLTDVLVSSYNVGATQVNSDAQPRDQFSLSFTKIEMTDAPVDAAGRLGGTVFGGWDFRANKEIPPPLPT